MVLNDPLANMLSKMQNALRVGKKEVEVRPVSSLVIRILDLLKAHGYVTHYEITDTTKGKFARVTGFDNVNKCGVIKPRFNFKVAEIIEYEQHYLPAKGFGIVVVSTPKGIMTSEEARNARLGGKLLAYCY